MELEQCKNECERIQSKYFDANGQPKILKSKLPNFNMQVVDVLPFKYSDDEDDYSVVVKIQRVIDGKESLIDLYTLNQNYSISTLEEN